MAFARSGFTTIGGMGGEDSALQVFSYRSSDALATIAGSGYFNTVAQQIHTGDRIHVYSSAATGGGSADYALVNTANVITVGTTSAYS